MRYITLIVFLCFLSPSLHAQWEWRHPSPQGNDLWNVHFAPGSSTGWAVGAAGVIIKSTDSGSSWSNQESHREDIFRGVYALSAYSAYVVGDNGVVLHTSTGGLTWQKQNSSTTAGINTVHAVNSSFAAFVGDAGLLHTTSNGGATWTPRSTGTSNNLNGVFFTSTQNGVAVGSGTTIVQTTNGGVSWTARQVFPGQFSSDLIDVFFVDASYGWAVGTGGGVIRSTDGGTTWSRMTNNGTSADLNKVRFSDRQNGYAAGESGAIYRSTNGGAYWSTVTSGTSYGLEGLALQGASTVAVGLYGVILRSVNNNGFSMVTSGTRSSINAVTAAIPSTAWAVTSDGEVLASTNGGISWQLRAQPVMQPLYGIDNINGQTLLACGNGGLVLRSTNGGYNWSSIASGTSVALNAVDMLDSDTGYIVGSTGRIIKTTNGGAGWYPVASGTLESLLGVHFTDSDHGTIVGTNGKVLSTTNGGYTWSHQQSWTQDALFHVIRDGNRGMLCGDDGTLSCTTDGGQHWTDCPGGTTAALFHLTHPAPNEYAAVGEDGTIMRTSNFGQTWVREISHAQHTLYSADAHGGNVYVVGDYGTVLRNGTYPYPVTLRAFTASEIDGCVQLHWLVEDEQALLGYAIERLDATGWEEIGFVKSSSSLRTASAEYQWRDCLVATAGTAWRLRMVDMDGSTEYSPELRLVGTAEPGDWKLEAWPRPSHGNVTLLLPDGVAELDVYDMSGRLLRAFSISEMNDARMQLSGSLFPSTGSYLLVARNTNHITSIILQVMK
ncbi:hypothetical protein KQI65_04800 [bacterium]|nr:hypothetical protein [bacterium]